MQDQNVQRSYVLNFDNIKKKMRIHSGAVKKGKNLRTKVRNT